MLPPMLPPPTPVPVNILLSSRDKLLEVMLLLLSFLLPRLYLLELCQQHLLFSHLLLGPAQQTLQLLLAPALMARIKCYQLTLVAALIVSLGRRGEGWKRGKGRMTIGVWLSFDVYLLDTVTNTVISLLEVFDSALLKDQTLCSHSNIQHPKPIPGTCLYQTCPEQ